MLERFQKAKEKEVDALRALAAKGALPKPLEGKRPDFALALEVPGSLAIIAEYNKVIKR